MISFNKINKVNGILNLGGDKSISHRVLIISAIANGKSSIKNISNSVDVNTTLMVLSDLGIEYRFIKDSLEIFGGKLSKCIKPLFCGNSGTTVRLLSGVLAMQGFNSVLTGDESLSRRPMKRVIKPLTEFGAEINAKEENFLPIEITPSRNLKAIKWHSEVASAQVKSAILLAGLFLDEETEYFENIPTRDHTERLLNLKYEKTDGKEPQPDKSFVENVQNGNISAEFAAQPRVKKIFSSRNNFPVPAEYFIPNDISSASFFIVLTLLSKNSLLRIPDVSLNETRTGFLRILQQMGGRISVSGRKVSNNEEYGEVIVESSQLKNVEISEEQIPNIIDEIPILAAAGIFAEGSFSIRGARELRVKESDRINAVCKNFRLLGLEVKEFEDGFTIASSINDLGTKSVLSSVGRGRNIVFESFNDHRIAMTMAIVSLLLDNGGKIDNFECVKISNPNFLEQIKNICR